MVVTGKTNKKEWKILARFNHITDASSLPYPNKIFAYDIVNTSTSEILRVSSEIVNKMIDLDIMSISDVYDASIQKVDMNTFEYETDDGFLSQYISKRPSWDEYFMATAKLMSTRSTCDRLYVGAVIVKDNRIIGEGYNGSIAGHPHCDEVGHLMYEGGCKRTIHAEANALQNCTINPKGATAYVTHYPCPDCMKALNQAGIINVVYGEYYKHRYENSFDTGMQLKKFKGKQLEFKFN